MTVDRRRQRATKRRIKRQRLNRRYGRVAFWAAVALVPLAIAAFYLNHYVLTRGEVTITVDAMRQDVAQNHTRYRVIDQTGKSYWLEGGDRFELYTGLRRGVRYRCRVRGMDLEIPLFWDWAPEITRCDRL